MTEAARTWWPRQWYRGPSPPSFIGGVGCSEPCALHSFAPLPHSVRTTSAPAIPPFATVGLKLGFYYTRLLLAILLHAALRLSEPAARAAIAPSFYAARSSTVEICVNIQLQRVHLLKFFYLFLSFPSLLFFWI